MEGFHCFAVVAVVAVVGADSAQADAVVPGE